MADAGLKIVIGADISKGVAGLNNVNKALSSTAKASSEATTAFGKAGGGVNQAANALTNLSRVAQDAPFGFIGIQNNLNPLLESFGRLKQETGSSGAALKALGSSLAGPAGVGLALGVVSGLLTVVIQKYGSFGNAIDALTSSTTAAATAQRDIAKAFAEAEGSAAGEIANINALLSVARNETLSKKARAEAINKLNQEYDSYLPKLTQENISTQAVTEAVDKLTKSLIRQAKIKGLQDLISKETAKQAELFAKSLSENADWIDNIAAGLKSLSPAGNFFNEQAIAGAKTIGKEYQATQKRIEKFNDFLKQLTTEEAVAGTLFDEKKAKKGEDILKKQLDAITKIRDAAKDFQGKLFDLKEIDKATDSLAKLEQQVGNLKLQIAVRDAKKAGLPAAEIEKLKDAINQDTQKRLNEAFEKEAILLEFSAKLKTKNIQALDVFDIAGRVFASKEKIKILLGENGVEVDVKKEAVDVTDLQGKIAKATGLDKKITIRPQFEIDKDLFGRSFADAQERLRQQIAGLKEILFNGVVNGMQDVASALGEAFANIISGETVGSSFAKAAKSLLNIVGGILQQMGAQIIITSKAVAVLKKALNNLFGPGGEAAGLAAGLLLVATGSILKNIKFDGPKFATGGIVSSPLIGQIGEAHRPEVILPLDRLPQLFKQFGGDMTGGTQLIPIINNEGLYLAMKRGERSAGRKF